MYYLIYYSIQFLIPVYEKERMWGHDPYIPEEATFGEYNKS